MTVIFHHWRKYLLLVVLSLALLPVYAQKDIQLNLQNADLREFVETVSKITGKNFVMNPAVQGSVTIISPEKFDKKSLYDIFLNVLAVNGFSAVKGSGGVIKIVPNNGSNFIGYDGISQVHKLSHIEAAQMLPTLQPLLPAGSHISADTKNNLLIISGQPSDVRRAIAIIERIDRGNSTDFDIIRLQNASASDVARTVNDLIAGQGNASSVKIVADERTNSILLQAPHQEKLRLKTLVTHLDTPIENAGNTEVIYLKNANAVEVAKTLSAAKQTISVNAEEGQAIDLTQSGRDNIDIRADEATNSLIITAPPATMRNFKQVIAKLDIRRAQVLVEAIIAEVKVNDFKNLGVQWYAAGRGSTMPIGIIDFTNAGSSLLGLAGSYYAQKNSKSGVSVPVDKNGRPAAISNGATFGIGNDKVGVLINALNGLNDTNILSTPSLVVMDNEKAEFLVGENIPYVTGSYTTNGNGSSNPFQTVERQDVGIKLNIKPQISEGDTISLDIYQEVSNVTGLNDQQGPTTAKRALKTTVLVEDDQVLVLGGLIDNRQASGKQKVPVLGDIPVVGGLFRSTTRSGEKRNLMVFIRPKILRNKRSANYATQEKYDHIRRSQLNYPLATPETTLTPIELDIDGEQHLQAPAPVYERGQPYSHSRH